MYFITFSKDDSLCSYVIQAENLSQAYEVAKLLSKGGAVNVVAV